MSNFQTYLIVGNDTESQTLKLIEEKGARPRPNSPDFFKIQPIKTSISIDQIRQLKNHIYQKPLSLPYKFVVIKQAHKLTIEAQNALLKILEEPPSQAVIILQSQDKSQLLPTILSRVVVVSSYSERENSGFQAEDESESAKRGRENSGLQAGGIYADNKSVSLEEIDLEQINQIDDPVTWLDQKIVEKYQELIKDIEGQKSFELEKSVSYITKLSQIKMAIAANVNPKFALASLLLQM